MSEIDCTAGIGHIFGMVNLRNCNGQLLMLHDDHWYEVDIEKNLRKRNPIPEPHEKKLIDALWSVKLYRHFIGTNIFGVEFPEISFSYYWMIGDTDRNTITAQLSKVKMLRVENEHLNFEMYQTRLREIGHDVCKDKFISAVRDL